MCLVYNLRLSQLSLTKDLADSQASGLQINPPCLQLLPFQSFELNYQIVIVAKGKIIKN